MQLFTKIPLDSSTHITSTCTLIIETPAKGPYMSIGPSLNDTSSSHINFLMFGLAINSSV